MLTQTKILKNRNFYGSSGIAAVCSNKEQAMPDEFDEKIGDSGGYFVYTAEGEEPEPRKFRNSQFYLRMKIKQN